MTRKFLSLFSGLMVIFLSLNSLYALEFEKWYSSSPSNYPDYTVLIAFSKKGQTDYKKALFAVFSEMVTNDSEITFLITANISEKVKLKTYSLYIGNESGNAIIKDVGKYTGKTENNHYSIKLNIQKEYFSNIFSNYIILNINDKYYKLEAKLFDNPFRNYERELENERRRKEYEERQYKRSSEYQRKIKQPIIDKLDKNLYNIKKDAFDSRIHITSKRVSGKIDGEALAYLRKNDVFIIPRLELEDFQRALFGATFNIKYRSNGTGVGYLQAVSFSNGDKSTLIRFGQYGVGEVGNSFYDSGIVISQVTVSFYNLQTLYEIFTEAGSKPILVRMYEGTGSYDTQISEKEKQMFIDLFKVKLALDNAE